MKSPEIAIIEAHGLRLSLNIGWTPRERAEPQPVDIDFAIRFDERPAACDSDDLGQTECYDDICVLIEKHCQSREFKLLETVGYELHSAIVKSLKSKAGVCVRITKVRPPIAALKNGSSFTFGEKGILR